MNFELLPRIIVRQRENVFILFGVLLEFLLTRPDGEAFLVVPEMWHETPFN